MFNKQARKNKQTGFTTVELIIAITVMTILTPVVIFGLGNYYSDTIGSLTSVSQDGDTRSALSTITNDLSAVNGFSATLGVGTVTPLGSNTDATGNSDWSYCGTGTTGTTCDGVTANNFTTNRVLIAYSYATDGPKSNDQRLPVFINDSAPSFDLSSAQPATYATIYFVAKDRTNPSQYDLYRRTVVDIDTSTNVFRNISPSTGLWPCSTSNPSFTGCVTPYQKTSCASTLVGAYSSVCGATDAVLLYNVKSFWIDYYDVTNQPIANYYTNNATNAAIAAANIQSNAKSIQITITKIGTGSSPRTSTASTRILVQ